MSARLAPSATADSQFFWDAAKERRLVIQRCGNCGTLRHPPRPMCPHCHSLAWDTIDSAGRGYVYSCVIPRHPEFPWFPEPYVVAIVELDEGTRIVSNVVGVDATAVTVGMRVRVRFDEFDGGLVLPLFVPEDAP